MAEYKCFDCKKTVKIEQGRKRIRCPYCGSKILTKQRMISKKIKAI